MDIIIEPSNIKDEIPFRFLYYLPKYRLIICPLCQTAIIYSRLRKHLFGDPHNISNKAINTEFKPWALSLEGLI